MLPYHRKLLSAVGSGFQVQAVTFDDVNDYMTRGDDLTGNANGKQGIFSCWIKLADNGVHAVFRDADNECRVIIGNGALRVDMANVAGANILQMQCPLVAADGWTHILGAWDLATTTAQLYKNGVDVGIYTNTQNVIIGYTSTNWGVGWDGSVAELNADLADLYFNVSETLDISNAANLAKFIQNGKPVDLGDDGSLPTGSQPIVYFSNRPGDIPSDFGTNRGTGGNFTITGTLTEASTSPSD